MKNINGLLWAVFIAFVALCFAGIISLTRCRDERPVVITTTAEETASLETDELETYMAQVAPVEIIALPDYPIYQVDYEEDLGAQLALFQKGRQEWETIAVKFALNRAVAQLAQNAMARYDDLIGQIKERQRAINAWKEAFKRYPVATEVYYYLRNVMNLSQPVACGLLGHMMRECGGHSFNLEWWLVNYTGIHYGLCQWDSNYYPEVWASELQYQLDFLASNIEREFSIFGWLYTPGFTYDDWLALDSYEDAAVAFVSVYGRPLEHTEYDLKWRKQLAHQAYEYFVGEMGL